jgi:hypothetical protein
MNIGDRIVQKRSGCRGTIVNIYYNNINRNVVSVEFDTAFNGHDCGGYAKDGYGWNYLSTDFEERFQILARNRQYLLF